MKLAEIVDGAVGPYEYNCDGFNNAGASGMGYISVLKIATSKTKQTTDATMDLVISHDRAGATNAYTGQINMITATSFNGVNGAVWGYHLAKADLLASGSLKPLMTVKDGRGKSIPVYPVEPLLDAGERLLGTRDQKRFPLLPGAPVICARQAATASGYDSGNVWSSITLAIAEDREKACNLYLEDHGVSLPITSEKEVAEYSKQIIERLAKGALMCGENQRVKYKEIFTGFKVEFITPGEVGCAMTCCPYLVLATEAIPDTGPASMLEMTISEWEQALRLPPLKKVRAGRK